MEILDFIKQEKARFEEKAADIKDYTVFDFNYVPRQPLIRKEAESVIQALIRFQTSKIPNHLLLIGPRGSGKTLLMKYLAKLFQQEYGLPSYYVNCRIHNSSFKILAHLLSLRPRGYSYPELCGQFEDKVQGPAVIILDEADLISTEKDLRKDLLYFLSRSENAYALVLLSNNPRFLGQLDESTRSSLQPEVVHIKNYTAREILEILQERAREGLHRVDQPLLAEISALTTKTTNSDTRVAIKTLLYGASDKDKTVQECFDEARKDIVRDILADLNERNLLILRAAMEEETQLARTIFKRYVQISKAFKEEPYSYVHFYNNLAYMQSVGLVALISTKVNRTYTNKVMSLFPRETLMTVLEERFK